MNPIAWLSEWMTAVLHTLYAVTGNYGVAIILLTVIVKSALFPLTWQSTRQMAAMQKIQPKVDALKVKHKDNPQAVQQEMMLLYKEHGVNPFGGCLPMLLQIPFFLALFFALSDKAFIELLSQPGIKSGLLWIKTVALPDALPFVAAQLPMNLNHLFSPLVLLIALSTYLSQKTMGVSSPQQKQMQMFMPVFIALISAGFPAGVQLYWVVSNMLTVGQQMFILRKKEA